MSDPAETDDAARRRSVAGYVQVDGDVHYRPLRYLRPKTLAAIGYQFRAIAERFPESDVLEVGTGTGLTAELLRRCGHRVTTLDVDAAVRPDVLGSVTDIPLDDASHDVFACFEVLEHLPWEEVPLALAELARVTRRGGALSVPTVVPRVLVQRLNHRGHSRPFLFRLPTLFGRRRLKNRDGQHAWELGANRTRDELHALLTGAGFRVVDEFVAPEILYHHFFVVEPAAASSASTPASSRSKTAE